MFVHGSFHAAWCWAERWLPFFSRAGFRCFALSLRAQVVRHECRPLVAGGGGVNISEPARLRTENKVSEKQMWLEIKSDISIVDAVAQAK